jgi:hypothetical protein
MKCEDAAEFLSALHDGEKIPRDAAEHLGHCEECRDRMIGYSAVGTELRRIASVEKSAELPERAWSAQVERRSSRLWQKGAQTMRIPRFAVALMVCAILVLSGGLAMEKAKAGSAGKVLRLRAKLPDGKKPFDCFMPDKEEMRENCAEFRSLPQKGLLSVGVRFVRRDGQRSEVGIKAVYDNPYPEWMLSRPSNDRFADVAEEKVWIEPGESQQIAIPGLGLMEITGEYVDHKPPFPFSPDDTIDVEPNIFRMTGPVLLRGSEVVFNFGGASGQFDDEPGNGDAVYWPGEGRFLFSLRPFRGAVEGKVFGSQVEFQMEGQTYTLLTGVPPTSAEHVWIKHEADYRPSQSDSHSKDNVGFLGGAERFDFAAED